MVAAEFGNIDFAYSYFMKTAKIDIEAKYHVYVGTIFMGGSHPAANGGAWMTAVFGFGGVRAGVESVTINPRLYKKWNKLEFNLVYKGNRFTVKINQIEVEVLADASNKSKQTFIISGKPYDCEAENNILTEYI
jgi:kojibiose phosphorylase